MSKPKFVYVTYIKTTPEKLWDALTKPEITPVYWAGVWQDSTWVPGSSWKMMFSDGRVGDTGEIVESDKPRRLVIRWRNEFRPELKAEGFSICTITIEPEEHSVKLTITHDIDKPDSKFIEAVSNGWPSILSNLKTLLETGEPLESSVKCPKN